MATSISIVIASSLMAVMTFAQIQHQRPIPPAFSRSGLHHNRGIVGSSELESHQTVPQPFRRVSLPLYRGRGFSLDGQEPKSTASPPVQQQTSSQPIENNDEFNRTGNSDDENDVPQPTRQALLQQKQVDRGQQQQHFDRIQQQQQHVDSIQQQPEKQFPAFRPQLQIQQQQQPPVETQPQFVRKVVQRPLKRVQVAEETAAISRSPETIQKLKIERSESADKQRAKKPVSQVLRRYRDDNPDGSITWGFENDDGTFKEETIGVDCVTRGKYGYVDPDGVKREYSYQSGVPCDKNRKTLQTPDAGGQPQSSAVQEAQASDAYGYIDYARNQYVMANGQTINLNGMVRNRARKPVPPRKTAAAAVAEAVTGNGSF